MTGIRTYCTALLSLFICCSCLNASENDSESTTKKPLVAVVDFNAKSARIMIGQGISGYLYSDKYIDLFNAELMNALVNDRSFDVMDRARLHDLAKDRLLKTVTPLGMSAIGKEAGADYIVCGDIELLELDKRFQQFPGYSQTQMLGRMVVNLRVVEVKSSRILFAKKVNNVLTVAINQYSTTTPHSFMEELKSDTVRRLVTNISEGISPIQIRAVHDGKVYLNRGEQAFRGGEMLEIVVPVDTIYDEDGSILDVIEEHAGKVCVETVRPKVAIAGIVEESRPMQVGWIARRIEE